MKTDTKPDERETFSRAVYALKEKHGLRVAAHLLYHHALTLTREADAAALAEVKPE